MAENYIDNERFHQLILEYHERKKQNPKERIPEEVGKMIITMAKRLATRYVFNNYCVDEKTEALTQRGWLSFKEITIDDTILSYDMESKHLVWSRIKSIYIDDYEGKMFYLTNRFGLNALVTPGHKMITNERGLIPVDMLKTNDHIVLTGLPVLDGPGFYEDRFIEFVGWCITEGQYTKGQKSVGVILAQKEGEKANRIRQILIDLSIPYKEYMRDGNLVVWVLKNSHYTIKLHEVAPDKILSSDFILSLTQHQRELLIRTMVDGDGWSRNGKPIGYVQKCKKHVDQFLFLCTISGMTVSCTKRFIVSFGKDTFIYHMNIYQNPKLYCRAGSTDFHGGYCSKYGVDKKPNAPTIDYSGKIWCPETEYGSFMCRRESKIFLTGNTFKEEFINDAILRAVEIFDNYDPVKYDKPFAYFTLVMWRTFLQRIQKEKQERTKREKLVMVDDIFSLQEGDDCDVNKDSLIQDYVFNSYDE